MAVLSSGKLRCGQPKMCIRDRSSEQVAYPRITWATRRGNETGCVHFDSAPRNPIQVEWIEDQPPEIASRLLDEVKDGGCAAWICNTVGRAQAAYEEMCIRDR